MIILQGSVEDSSPLYIGRWPFRQHYNRSLEAGQRNEQPIRTRLMLGGHPHPDRLAFVFIPS